MEKVVITVAPTGPLTTRDEHPGVPLSPEEIGIAVAEAAAEGAAVAHVHARGPDGRPTADPHVYSAIVDEIRSRCDVVVQASTGVGLDVPWEERAEIIESGLLDVPMATLNPASMSFATGTFHNPPELVERLAAAMREQGIRPELEVYDVGHVALCLDLVRRGLIDEPLQFSFVMGVRGGMPGDPALLTQVARMLPASSVWQVIGVGRHQLPLTLVALALGANVRTGFEDNVYWSRGVLAESNAQFVRRAATLVRAIGREPASPDDVRQHLRLAA